MPNINKIHEPLFKGDFGRFIDFYHEELDDVIEFVKNYQGSKSYFGISELTSSLPHLHACMALSDLTTLTISGQGQQTFKLVQEAKGVRITIPNHLIVSENIPIGSDWRNVGYWQPSTKAVIKFIRALKPAINSGRILVRPSRVALFKASDGNFRGVQVEPDAKKMDWIASEQDRVQGTLPFKVITDRPGDLELAVPYLSGIETGEYVKILEDNTDCIKNLRSGVKRAVGLKELNASELKDIRNDIIDPALAELERSYKRITSVARTKLTGTAVGLVSVSLSAIITDQGGVAIPALLGAGGFGLLSNQMADYREKLAILRDNPYYLFWKAGRSR